MTVEMRGEASVFVAAPPQNVYELITDITRMGEWSPECRECEWVEGGGPVVGASFHGRNQRDANEWTTPNTVIAADEGREFAWVVGTAEFRVCTWRYELVAEGEGTRVTESFELGKEQVGFTSSVLERPEEERQPMIDARQAQLVSDMQETLRRLKEVAEARTSVS